MASIKVWSVQRIRAGENRLRDLVFRDEIFWNPANAHQCLLEYEASVMHPDLDYRCTMPEVSEIADMAPGSWLCVITDIGNQYSIVCACHRGDCVPPGPPQSKSERGELTWDE